MYIFILRFRPFQFCKSICYNKFSIDYATMIFSFEYKQNGTFDQILWNDMPIRQYLLFKMRAILKQIRRCISSQRIRLQTCSYSTNICLEQIKKTQHFRYVFFVTRVDKQDRYAYIPATSILWYTFLIIIEINVESSGFNLGGNNDVNNKCIFKNEINTMRVKKMQKFDYKLLHL